MTSPYLERQLHSPLEVLLASNPELEGRVFHDTLELYGLRRKHPLEFNVNLSNYMENHRLSKMDAGRNLVNIRRYLRGKEPIQVSKGGQYKLL